MGIKPIRDRLPENLMVVRNTVGHLIDHLVREFTTKPEFARKFIELAARDRVLSTEDYEEIKGLVWSALLTRIQLRSI